MNDIQRILDNVIEGEMRKQNNFEDFDFVPDDDSAPDYNGYEPDYRDFEQGDSHTLIVKVQSSFLHCNKLKKFIRCFRS